MWTHKSASLKLGMVSRLMTLVSVLQPKKFPSLCVTCSNVQQRTRAFLLELLFGVFSERTHSRQKTQTPLPLAFPVCIYVIYHYNGLLDLPLLCSVCWSSVCVCVCPFDPVFPQHSLLKAPKALSRSRPQDLVWHAKAFSHPSTYAV